MATTCENTSMEKKPNMMDDTLLDKVIADCGSTAECGLGAQDCICCAPCCSPCCSPCCKPCCKPCKRPSPCAPCGACGPVRCPCNLTCAPMGTGCCCITQPRCVSMLRGCKLCCNNCCIPRQPLVKPRCVCGP